jgi:hypothetical protein
MTTRSIERLSPEPDFLAQIAESFGVERDEALILLGKLLASYEPSWCRAPQSLGSDGESGNRPSRAA